MGGGLGGGGAESGGAVGGGPDILETTPGCVGGSGRGGAAFKVPVMDEGWVCSGIPPLGYAGRGGGSLGTDCPAPSKGSKAPGAVAAAGTLAANENLKTDL